MRFYVLAKCIEEEKAHIVIDFESRSIKRVELSENIEEDKTYVYANEELIQIRDVGWTVKESYQLAFNKIRKIDLKEYKWIRLNIKDRLKIDENYFMYNHGKLMGRIVNEKEVNHIKDEGLEKIHKVIERFLEESIVLLHKGKKIYRIFTYSKLKTFFLEQNNQISIAQYLNKGNKTMDPNVLRGINKDILEIYEKLGKVVETLKEKINE
ncbi:hypothetical protein QBE52_07900 [Clostridiaceae bacterium 35-E11]